ncbi:hypothetical protein AC578_4691 [Pseudocercospora eumusae]|uniref:Uncharacterized protein n=1 Tax=Pseudocercospora eumusae TaxID=321146 RepID=A0A139H7A4_9PEZI|nr:hypothetical protein AC578_4691 [Pseudocercospora eumusae]
MPPARTSAAVAAVLLTLTVSSVAGTWILWIWNGGFRGFQDAMAASRLPDGLQVALEYSGLSIVDEYLRRCVFMTMPVVARASKQALLGRPLILVSIVDLSAAVFVILLEADRKGGQHGNGRMQTLWAFLWLSAIANLSLAVIIPIYALANLTSLVTLQTSGNSLRGVDVLIDLFAVIACLATPGLMLLDPYNQGWISQSTWLAIFGAFPGSVPLAKIAIQIVLYLATITLGGGSNQAKKSGLGQSTVQKVLFGSGLVLSLIRGAAFCYVIFNPHITLRELFTPSFDELRGVTGYSVTCLTFMKLDYVLSAAAILVIAYHVLAVQFPYHGWVLVLGVCLVGGVFGAGGTLLLVWSWRESWVTSPSGGVRL